MQNDQSVINLFSCNIRCLFVNLIVLITMPGILLGSVLKITSRDNNGANTPEALCSVDVHNLLNL